MSTEHGFTFASIMALGPQLAIDTARDAEALGYTSFWTAETTGPEAFSTLAAAGGAAPALGLGTGVIALQLRTPMVVAMAAATLQALQPERDVYVGIGISSPVVTERWHGVDYGDRPLARCREYMTLLKEIWAGDAVTFDGDFYGLKRSRLGVRLGDKKPKVVLGALNPKMLALGGEVADGVLLNYLPASHVPWSVEQIRAGEARRSDDGAATVFAYVHAGVTDREQGVESARKDLFSYAVVDAYARNFERAGFGDSVAEVRERHAERDRDGAVAAISDEFVDAIDFMGTADEVAAFGRSYVAAGVDVPILMPLPWGPDRRQIIEDTMRAFVS
ncbi:MAG: LLM class flavin-dependent oxidoreductase [Acidimicrobiales bacterium]